MGVVGEKARSLAIPATLQSSLTARLDRLGDAKTIAQIGAVLGREFSYDLLSAVYGIDGPALTQALDQLVNAEILYQSGLPPTSRYVFKHALIQKAAYDAILRGTLPAQHRRIAEVLKQRFGDLIDKQPELIAHHYAEAGMQEQAIPYLEKAGQRALDRAANTEAIAHLSTALQFLSTVPASGARDEQELTLRHALAPAYMAIKGWASDEVEETCGKARELGKLLGDFNRTYGAQWGRWTNYFLRGRLGEALETSLEVLQMAGEAGTAMLRVTAHHAVGYSHFYRGEFRQVVEHALQAEPLFSAKDERAIIRTFQFSSTAALRIMHGSSLWMLGFPVRAPALVDSGIALTRELNHRPSEAFALAASLLLHAYNLDVERAGSTAEELRKLAKEQGNEIWGPFAAMFNGWVLVERGQTDRGLEEFRSGIAGWQGARNHLNQTIVMAMLGRSLWKAGRADAALDTLDTEVQASRTRQELQFAPELHRLKGEILLERDAFSESEASFENALTLARHQGALMLELRAATSLGRLWAQTGRAEDARQLVSEVHGRFTEGHETLDLRDARALLDRLAGADAEPRLKVV